MPRQPGRPGPLPRPDRGPRGGRRAARPGRRRGAADRRRRAGVRADRPGAAPRRTPVVVHPQFTEPEAALRAAGHAVHRVVLARSRSRSTRDSSRPTADLVMLGNPTNPTSVAHPPPSIAALARPGPRAGGGRGVRRHRCSPPAGRRSPTLACRASLVLRSLTKTWGLAGLRVGYLLGRAGRWSRRLRAVAPLWPVATPALAAIVACLSDAGRGRGAADRGRARDRPGPSGHRVALDCRGSRSSGEPSSSFALVRVQGAELIRAALRERGFAVRRGDTFPGLGPDWLRIAVRRPEVTDGFWPRWPTCSVPPVDAARPAPRLWPRVRRDRWRAGSAAIWTINRWRHESTMTKAARSVDRR